MQTSTQWKSVRAEPQEGGRLLRIVLDCGRGNVLDMAAICELREALLAHGTAHALCALVLDHEGPDFSFGASVPEHAPGKVDHMLPAFHALARELLALDVPVLAAVRGRCLGGGLELAMLADRIFAAPDAVFGQPEVRLGVFAPLGSLLLPRLVGPHRAADLLLTGRTFGAEEARDLGLVAELAADPTATALSWARTNLLPLSAEALHHATRAARLHWTGRLGAELARLESQYLHELMGTQDAREGIQSFLEKRKPEWRHR